MNFQIVEQRYQAALASFASGGYQFDSKNTLYKQSQMEAFQGYLDGISKGIKHGYIELPTGVGKTALFISFIRHC